jgi:hypothetical protein
MQAISLVDFTLYPDAVSCVMLVLTATFNVETNGRDTKPAKSNRDARLSSDGKWRSFPKVPNLLQYIETDVYFGRVKVEGKIFRSSLRTDVFTTAKLLSGDFLKQKAPASKQAAHRDIWRSTQTIAVETDADHTLGPDARGSGLCVEMPRGKFILLLSFFFAAELHLSRVHPLGVRPAKGESIYPTINMAVNEN